MGVRQGSTRSEIEVTRVRQKSDKCMPGTQCWCVAVLPGNMSTRRSHGESMVSSMIFEISPRCSCPSTHLALPDALPLDAADLPQLNALQHQLLPVSCL